MLSMDANGNTVALVSTPTIEGWVWVLGIMIFVVLAHATACRNRLYWTWGDRVVHTISWGILVYGSISLIMLLFGRIIGV